MHQNKVFDEIKALWDDSQDIPEFLLRLARLGYLDVPSVPCVAILALTERCHGGCVYCSAATTPYAKKKELTLKEWTDVLDSLVRAGVSEIVLSGGEPLLREDFCNILEYAASHFYRVQILTSGIFPRPHEIIQNIRNIIRKYDSQFYIQVDIDSLREELHNTLRSGCQLETVKKNLNELLKIKRDLSCEIWINTVATRYNLFDIPSLITFFNKMPIDGVKIIPMALVGKAIYMKDIALTSHEKIMLLNTVNQVMQKEDLEIKVYYEPIEAGLSLMQKTQKFDKKNMVKPLCSVARMRMAITSNGYAIPCELAIKDLDGCFENIRLYDYDVKIVWQSSEEFNRWRDFSFNDIPCIKCEYLVCKILCPVILRNYGCDLTREGFMRFLSLNPYHFCPVFNNPWNKIFKGIRNVDLEELG